jgi:flagellar biogenesis protein FliO
MAQDRPEEFDRLYPRKRAEAEDDSERRELANVVVLLAAMALILIGYWVFNALGHSRRFQRCLDSGRINCVDFVSPAK